MAIRVLGFDVGLGVFLITFLWFACLVLILIFYRIKTILSLIFTCLAAVLTAIFLALPRAHQKDHDVHPLNTIYTSQLEMIDSVFLGRMMILSALTMSTLSGVILVIYLEVVQPNRKTVAGCPIQQEISSKQEQTIENIR